MHNVEKLVKEFALEVGFDLVGIASAAPFEDHRDVTLRRIGQGLMDSLPWFTGARVNRGAPTHRSCCPAPVPSSPWG